MKTLPPNNTNQILEIPSRMSRVITLRFNRNIILTLLISVLFHLSLLWVFAPKLFSIGAPQKDAPPTIEITLGPPQEKETVPSEQVLPDLRPLPQPPVEPTKPKPVKKTKAKKRPIEVVEKSETKIVKKDKINKELPKPIPQKSSPNPLPGEDMLAYIKRQKEAKLAKKGLSKQDIEEVIASNNPQSAGDKRDAKIKENLNLDGSNGIFEIRHLGLRTAQFSFKGWKNNINTARLEVIDVSVPDGTDVRKAVIRKMIAIIRREYDGDFNWDSRRLGRVLVLSARQQDNGALEAFMMNEFFGPGVPVR
ncbi:MAG: hypothetical protein ACKE5M_02940 [Methylophilaceae bacterium]